MKPLFSDLLLHIVSTIIAFAVFYPIYFRRLRKERKLMQEVQKVVTDDLEDLVRIEDQFYSKLNTIIDDLQKQRESRNQNSETSIQYNCTNCGRTIPVAGFCKTCNDRLLDIELNVEKENANHSNI